MEDALMFDDYEIKKEEKNERKKMKGKKCDGLIVGREDSMFYSLFLVPFRVSSDEKGRLTALECKFLRLSCHPNMDVGPPVSLEAAAAPRTYGYSLAE